MKKGKLIVIEGSDGSGKQTQAKKLYQKLIKEGRNVKLITFPNYKSDSSALIKMYLAGEFGKNPNNTNIYAVSTFYAIDRFASYKKDWEDFYLNGGIIIADRYTTSNMVHQAAKLKNKEEKEKYLDWLWDLEFNKYKLPIPNEVIFLNVEPKISKKLIQNRPNKITNRKEKDIHENNLEFLEKSYKNAIYVSNKYNWVNINCTKNNKILDIEYIHNQIYKNVIKVI